MNESPISIIRFIACILLIAVGIMSISSGCIGIDTNDLKLFSDPYMRLERDPSIFAACQYEFWKNTTRITEVITSNSIVLENRTAVYWVCYYRNGDTTTQYISYFKDTTQASNYLWYYYENGRNFPFIVVKS